MLSQHGNFPLNQKLEVTYSLVEDMENVGNLSGSRWNTPN